MKKPYRFIISFILVLSAMLVGIFVILKPWSSKVRTVKMTTQIKVYEGTVEVYKLDETNHRVFYRTLHDGESTDVTVNRRIYGDGGIFAPLSILTAKSVHFIFAEAEQRSREVKKNEYSKIFKEDVFTQRIADALEGKVNISNINIKFSKDGFEGSCRFKQGVFDVKLVGRGIIWIDWQGKFCLKLDEVQLGSFKAPDFVLRQIEDVFYNSSNTENRKIKVLEWNFTRKYVQIKCRKIRHAELGGSE